MADYPALPLWTDKYLADTRHLSAQEHGAYLLLLMEAWRRPSCSLPNDETLLCRLACCSPAEWATIRDVVMGFWKLDGRRKEWTQKALSRERDFLVKQSAKQRDRAAKRWETTKNTDAEAMPEGCRSDAPTPTPTIDNSLRSLSVAATPKRSKGTRLPTDWIFPDDWGRWAQETLKVEPRFIRQQAEVFRDYWISKTGQTATKTDWEATWRNWMRRAMESRPRDRGGSPRQPSMLELNNQLLAEMENADAGRETDSSGAAPPARHLPDLRKR